MTNGFDMFYVEHYVKYRAIIQYCITDHMSLKCTCSDSNCNKCIMKVVVKSYTLDVCVMSVCNK